MERGTVETEFYGMQKRIDSALNRLDKDKQISDRNKKIIKDFLRYCSIESLSKARVLFYAVRMRKISKFLKKDFDTADKKEIENLIIEIDKDKCASRSKYDLKTAVKKFYKWLKGTEEYPDLVKWIKVRDRANKKLPEELLTIDEVKKLIDTADNPQDKAVISCLYESGCRIGEIGTLRIKNVAFDKYGVILIVNGKTGMRRVRLITSVHYLTNWLENHPLKNNQDAPLWVTISSNLKGKALNYTRIRERISKIAKRAGLKKRVNPHLFRHSRATHLANKLTEAQMKEHFGWVQGSDMAAVYVHLSGRDVDKALLQIHGIVEKESKDEFINCPRCLKQNIDADRFCRYCGMPLNMGAVVEIEDKRGKIDEKLEILMKVLEDEEVKEFLAKKMAKLS